VVEPPADGVVVRADRVPAPASLHIQVGLIYRTLPLHFRFDCNRSILRASWGSG
jgi:hypothetical protein